MFYCTDAEDLLFGNASYCSRYFAVSSSSQHEHPVTSGYSPGTSFYDNCSSSSLLYVASRSPQVQEAGTLNLIDPVCTICNIVESRRPCWIVDFFVRGYWYFPCQGLFYIYINFIHVFLMFQLFAKILCYFISIKPFCLMIWCILLQVKPTFVWSEVIMEARLSYFEIYIHLCQVCCSSSTRVK